MVDISRSDRRKIAVLGAPIDIGASQRGTLMGPAALRTAGLLTVLEGLGFDVEDHGDLSIGGVPELADDLPGNARHYREIQRWSRALSRSAHELAQSGAIAIFLGGDHSLSMGSINGVARYWREVGRELFVIWLDAHGGATYREAHLVMEMLHDSGLVRSADVVELNPFLDERGRTARTAVELIGSLFGQQISDRPTPTNAIEPGD